MTTITIKGGLYYDTRTNYEPPSRYVFLAGGVRAFDTYTPICPHDIVADIGDFDPRPAEIKALEAKKREITAAFSRSVMEIDARISKLQAIEFSGEAAA